MRGERINRNYKNVEEPDWKVERKQDLKRKRRFGEVAMGLVAMALVSIALTHSAKTSEIMSDEEKAKNVKKIEAEAVVFRDGVNARREPYVNNTEPNQLASIGEEGLEVVVDYNDEAYYYLNENDPNGGWYGFKTTQLSGELLEDGYISQVEARELKSDEKYGDGVIWCNEKYVDVIEASETS